MAWIVTFIRAILFCVNIMRHVTNIQATSSAGLVFLGCMAYV